MKEKEEEVLLVVVVVLKKVGIKGWRKMEINQNIVKRSNWSPTNLIRANGLKSKQKINKIRVTNQFKQPKRKLFLNAFGHKRPLILVFFMPTESLNARGLFDQIVNCFKNAYRNTQSTLL
jgi:hypothetical protein